MLSAKELAITWGNSPQYWQWISIPEARFEKVAELLNVWWFEIRGKTNTHLLSPRTRYSAYIVFKTVDKCPGLADLPVEVGVGLVGQELRERNEEIVSEYSPFDALPEECISKIISFTSPRDACVATSVCKTFESAVQLDSVWEKFLPAEYPSPIPPSRFFSSKKELYFSLCNDSVLIEDDKMIWWLDKASGKRCIMLSANKLEISWRNSPEFWQWLLRPELRFVKLSDRFVECPFKIHGVMNSQILSPRTRYSAYVVYKKRDRFHEFHNIGVGLVTEKREDGLMEVEFGEFFNDEELMDSLDCYEIKMRIIDISPRDAWVAAMVSKTFESAVKSDSVWEKFLPLEYASLIPQSRVFLSKKELYFALCDNPVLIEEGKKSFWLEKANGKKCIMLSSKEVVVHNIGNGLQFLNLGLRKSQNFSMDRRRERETRDVTKPKARQDGWMEAELGEFYNEACVDDTSVSVVEIKSPYWKRGLIIQGFEFRPTKTP
ncbi:hypothetical protein AALP_AA5G013000 [Arabis alpina]|uniref:F-box domain-containing protein n=1 Tax=Arabis alpina TaxID=50452 RepID=A0A087GU82_ARAAL|nr:hypothetical protein AALP_AA5G013000 [Arabis alpina]